MKRTTTKVITTLALLFALALTASAQGTSSVHGPKKKKATTTTVKSTTTKKKSLRESAADGFINGHGYVDLGLSVKWATCNVGASKPEERGSHYCWGETKTMSEGKDENMRLGDISGNSRYDAARANWGGTWRMPTEAEFNELKKYTTTKWITRNNMRGLLVTSKKNGKSIFLPTCGAYESDEVRYVGVTGYYWTATVNEGIIARIYFRDFNNGSFGVMISRSPDIGHGIRAVTN